MRILILSIIFLSAFYFLFPRSEEETSVTSIDQVKVKMAATERKAASAERVLTVHEKAKSASNKSQSARIDEDAQDFQEEPVDNYQDDPYEDQESDVEGDSEADLPAETSMMDLEEGWNGELLNILGRLEPYEAEALHKSYLQEQEAYHKGLEALLNEGQNSPEAAMELEQIQAEFDQQHQEKLKNILGPHYETVMDQYHQFMEVTSQRK